MVQIGPAVRNKPKPRKKPAGWRRDSARHALAARGIKTTLFSPYSPWYRKQAIREASTGELRKLLKESQEARSKLSRLPPMAIYKMYPGEEALRDFTRLIRIEADVREELRSRGGN
jgi:hypothetical protein